MVNSAVLIFCGLCVAYPLIFVVSSSFSSPNAVIGGRVFLWPLDPSLAGYQTVFNNEAVWRGYLNTFFYTGVGTTLNVAMTIMIAYPLSRRDFRLGRVVLVLFLMTMFFSGGIIPTYLLVRNLGLLDTRAAMIVPQALSVWNVIILRTYFRTNLPRELLESAQMDGCSNRRFIISVALPLCRAAVAVIALFYAVQHWNAFFDAIMYLTDSRLHPLQIVLRNILIRDELDHTLTFDVELEEAREYIAALLKYSLIVVSTVPVLIAYPFAQKHFVKGLLVGSLKG